MALSKVQMTLIQYLKAFDLTEESIIGTMLLLPEDEEVQRMIDWLDENLGATQNQILLKSLELTKLESEELCMNFDYDPIRTWNTI